MSTITILFQKLIFKYMIGFIPNFFTHLTSMAMTTSSARRLQYSYPSVVEALVLLLIGLLAWSVYAHLICRRVTRFTIKNTRMSVKVDGSQDLLVARLRVSCFCNRYPNSCH